MAEKTVEQRCYEALKARGVTFAAAESCTGGLIAKRITDVPGASGVFMGGVVSYTNIVKHRVLGVPADMLEEYGAVSAPVARAMAEGARKATTADCAVSVTGVAGPDRDERGNPVGTVFIGFSSPKETIAERFDFGAASREEIRGEAADEAFKLLEEKLKETSMWKVYTEIELPLVFTQDSMEKWGIEVKGEELKNYGDQLTVRIQELEKLIWQQAGEEFNINSPKQLGVILFEKMGIPGGKKT